MRRPRRLPAALLPLVPVGLAALVYWPITGAYFFADDLVSMFDVANTGFLRFALRPFSGHVLLARNTLSYVLYRVCGLTPEPYYTLVLLTHLVNVWLLVHVVHTFTRSPLAAFVGGTLWGTSPLQAGTLGWYSVYGQVLAGTILLVVLAEVAGHARGGTVPSLARALRWYGLLLLGTICFGVGIAVALVFPAVLFLLLPEAFRVRHLRLIFLTLPVVVPALYMGFQWAYTLLAPTPLAELFLLNNAFRRAGAIFTMTGHLTSFGLMRTLLGFLFLHAGYPGPIAYIVVAGFAVLLVTVGAVSPAPTRRLLLGMVLAALAVYGIIALGRANVYVVFGGQPAASATVLRYHYVATIPLVVAACVILGSLTRGLPPAVALGALAAWLGLATAAYARSDWTIEQRLRERAWVADSLRTVAGLIEARPAGTDVYIENEPAPGRLLGRAFVHANFPGWAALFVIAYPANQVHGRQVYFVERDDRVVTVWRTVPGARVASLLVSRDGHGGPAAGVPP